MNDSPKMETTKGMHEHWIYVIQIHYKYMFFHWSMYQVKRIGPELTNISTHLFYYDGCDVRIS
jgi:hypothetical protein